MEVVGVTQKHEQVITYLIRQLCYSPHDFNRFLCTRWDRYEKIVLYWAEKAVKTTRKSLGATSNSLLWMVEKGAFPCFRAGSAFDTPGIEQPVDFPRSLWNICCFPWTKFQTCNVNLCVQCLRWGCFSTIDCFWKTQELHEQNPVSIQESAV